MKHKPLLVFIPSTLFTSEIFIPMLTDLPLETKTGVFDKHDCDNCFLPAGANQIQAKFKQFKKNQ